MIYTNPAFPTQEKDGLTDRQLIGAIVLGSVIRQYEPDNDFAHANWAANRTLEYVDAFLEAEKSTRK